MLQSNLSAYWADSFMPKICDYINKDEKGYLTPSSCIVCKSEGNNEMVVCDNDYCQSWTHNDCAGLTEEAARSSSYWCKLCVDDYVEKQEESSLEPSYQISTPSQNKHPHNKSKDLESDLSSILNFSKSPDSTISLDNSNKYQGNPVQPLNNLENSHSYLKHLHSKLVDLSKDDSIEEDLPEVAEIKNLLHYLREEVAKELTFSEPKESTANPEKNENQSPNKPVDLTRQPSNEKPEDPEILNPQIINDKSQSQVEFLSFHQSDCENSKDTDNSNIIQNDEIQFLENSASMTNSKQCTENEKSPNLSKIEQPNDEIQIEQTEINRLKAELEMKNSDISSYIDKINHLEELLNLKSSPQQTKHRLEHRNITSVIKEYTNLEERLKVLQKQLGEEINYKKHYKNKLTATIKEKEEALKSLKTLQNTPQSSNLKTLENEKIIENLRKEREEAHIEIMNLKELLSLEQSVKDSGFEAKDNVIINLQDQIKMDDEIKINLNNRLEEAFSEIKDLKDKITKRKRPTKNKSTNTTDDSNSQNDIDEQGPIDLTLPNRKRAAQKPNSGKTNQPQNNPTSRNDNQNEGFHRNRDKNFQNRQNMHENLPHGNQRQQVNTPEIIDVSYIHSPSMQPAGQSSRMTLNTRFKPTAKPHQRRQIVDYYDFALRDNRSLRTKNRPVCPWYIKNKCHSDVCVYQHPEKPESRNEQGITLDDISDTSSNYEKPVEICRYHLQKRCWFGSSCFNKHVNDY